MTRKRLRRTLTFAYVMLIAVLALSLATKLLPHVPTLLEPWQANIAREIYDYLKDMALVFVTVVATLLAGIFQRRQSFLAALKEEWGDIVKAKSALYAYTQLERPTRAEYITAFLAISETLDNMRTVYANVGETRALIGLYPFAPLHDMRRALQTLDPAKVGHVSGDDRRRVRDAVLQSFYALRESFLEELDLDEPDHPVLAAGSRRIAQPGATRRALTRLQGELERRRRSPVPETHLDDFLRGLNDAEQAKDGRVKPAVGPPEGLPPPVRPR